MDENGALVEGEVTSETQIIHSKPFTSDILTPLIAYGLPQERTRTSAVKNGY